MPDLHSRVLDALAGFTLGTVFGIGLAAAYLCALVARMLGEEPVALVVEAVKRRVR